MQRRQEEADRIEEWARRFESNQWGTYYAEKSLDAKRQRPNSLQMYAQDLAESEARLRELRDEGARLIGECPRLADALAPHLNKCVHCVCDAVASGVTSKQCMADLSVALDEYVRRGKTKALAKQAAGTMRPSDG